MSNLNKEQFNLIVEKLKKDGQLTASGILKEAKKKTSPLHNLFEWDDTKAAKEFRLMQARTIIKSANVYIEEPENKIVHVPINEGHGEGSYKFASVVIKDVDEFDMAMREASTRLKVASDYVDILQHVAEKHQPKKVGKIKRAAKSLKAASTAIGSACPA